MPREKYSGQPCYYCGAPSTSKEHVPAKKMFKGFLCDKITVPSCELHNGEKSGLDQAAINALLIGLDRPPSNGRQFDKDVQSAIANARPSFERSKRKAFRAKLISDPPEPHLGETSYLDDDIDEWIRQLTAALAWSATESFDAEILWDEIVIWSPSWRKSPLIPSPTDEIREFVEKMREFEKPLEAIDDWKMGWSANPKKPYPATIFHFQLHFEPDEVIFRHVFYNQYRWYVAFPITPSSQTLSLLKQKVGIA